jgi:chemotaxis protein methyltransferase CheR
MACHWGEQARRQDCLNPHHYYLQAAILMEQQRYDEAGRLLRQALYLQHDFILAHFLLGRLSLEQERPQEALRHFNNTLCLLDNYPDEESVPAAAGVTMGALRQVVSAIKNRLCEAGGRENAVGRGQ